MPHASSGKKKMKLSNVELTKTINQWCQEKGLKSRDLGCGTLINENGLLIPYQNAHPQIDDVIILIKWRDAMEPIWNNPDTLLFGALWQWCYLRGFPLKQKHLKALENHYIKAIERAEQRAQARQKIKALRKA